MRYFVKLKASEEACRLVTAEDRHGIATAAIAAAEKQGVRAGDEVIFDGPQGLIICVLWSTKTVHIITREEADRAYIPKSTASFN